MDTLIEMTTEPARKTFAATGSFTLTADGLRGTEMILLLRKGVSGEYHLAGNERGWIRLTATCNIFTVSAVGEIEWEVRKDLTAAPVGVGIAS